MGGSGFLRKAKAHKKEFRQMADLLIKENYHKDFKEPVIFIDVAALQNEELKAFCKRFHIAEISIQNYEDKGYTVPMDSVVIFHREYTPVLGSRRDIIVDFALTDRSYSNFSEYGARLVKIDSRMYYYKH